MDASQFLVFIVKNQVHNIYITVPKMFFQYQLASDMIAVYSTKSMKTSTAIGLIADPIMSPSYILQHVPLI